MNMTLSNIESKKLLPLFMRSDIFDSVICSGIDNIIKDVKALIDSNVGFWKQLDLMSEKQLDDVAEELCVHWYRYDAGIEQKRQIIKNAGNISRKLGTPWATEQILNVYFGEAYVVEYWEYGGEKKHFKVTTFNTDTVDRDAAMFMSVLDKIKRKSAILDYVEVLDYSTNDLLYIIAPGDAEYGYEYMRGESI